jgi:hypothetical protein
MKTTIKTPSPVNCSNPLFRIAPCTALLALLVLMGASPVARAQNNFTVVSNWFVTNGVASTHIATGDVNRGLAYSAVSNQVYVCNKGVTGSGTTPAIDVFNATNGAYLGSASMTGVSSGTFLLDQIAVADDGILYGINLQQTAVTGMKLYQWTNWNTAPSVAFSGDPTGGLVSRRMGDNLAIQGSGTNTVILAPTTTASGTQATTNVVLFSTTNGSTFTATLLQIGNMPAPTSANNGPAIAVSFYTNNTFLFKQNGGTLYLVQYPTNFASLSSPVQATVIDSNVNFSASGNAGQTIVSYNAAVNLLSAIGPIPGAAPSTTPANVYVGNPLTNISTSIGNTTFTHPNANGNFVGGVALAGSNMLFTLDCNNGVRGFSLVFPTVPIITGQPSSISGAYNPQTLTVTANGFKPLTYYWFSNTSSNIAGATLQTVSTNPAFTIANAVTNFYFVIVSNSYPGTATSSIVSVSLIPATTNAVVSNLFSIGAGNTNYPFVANDDNTRGIDYDTNTQRLVVANKTGGAHLYLLDGVTGANLGQIPTNGMATAGTFPIDQVGVADDGAVYAGNLATSPPFNLTRWGSAATNATAASAFSGDPGSGSGDRWGDNMAVRGSGANTQILLSSRGTNVSLLTTGDGLTYSSLTIGVPGVPSGFAGYGIAFGAGNTFWAKNYLGDLFEIAFDPTGSTPASVVQDYVAAGNAQIPSHMVGVGIDPVHSIFGGVLLTDQNPDLQLYQLTGSANPPVLFHQAFFPVYNPGANANTLACVSMKYPRAYALDVDIGIIGVTYGVPASTAPTISTPPVGGTIFAANVPFSLSVGVSGTLPLYYQWQKNSVSNLVTATNIPGATSGSYTLNSPAVSDTGWYDVIVTNFGGAATSAPVLLTVVQPVTSPVVTNVWRKTPGGTNSFLDSSSYAVRGLAYDTNSGTLLLADRVNTSITCLNAADGSASPISINTAGLPTGTFTLNQIGVGDDGILYGGNLAITPGDTFHLTAWATVSSSGSSEYSAYSGDPGSGSGDRWGDTMAVRGSGTNTQILLGSYAGTTVSLLTTADGMNFTSLAINVSNAPAGFSGLGIAFGVGNTFWADGGFGYNLRQVSFDPTGANPAVILQTYNAGTQIPTGFTGLGVDAANNILIGTCFSDTPNDLQFYQLSGTTNSPTLFDQAFYGTVNVNSQQNSASAIKFPWAFGLNVNNGLVAVTYNVPPPPIVPFSVTATRAGGSVVLGWPSVSGHNYNVISSATITAARSGWSTNATLAGTGGTLSYTNSSPTGQLFYAIQAK